jgi:predicted nucleotidyltransferase
MYTSDRRASAASIKTQSFSTITTGSDANALQDAYAKAQAQLIAKDAQIKTLEAKIVALNVRLDAQVADERDKRQAAEIDAAQSALESALREKQQATKRYDDADHEFWRQARNRDTMGLQMRMQDARSDQNRCERAIQEARWRLNAARHSTSGTTPTVT